MPHQFNLISIRLSPQAPSPRLDGIEDRPVAVGQHMPLWEWCTQLDTERAQHAVVAVVALQDDAGEHGGGRAATGTKLPHDSLALGLIERLQRLFGQLCRT